MAKIPDDGPRGKRGIDYDPSNARAIRDRIARLEYLRGQHRLADVKLTLELAKLQGDLERLGE